MSKVKNPCKFCSKTVTYKNGLQCSAMGWAHFKCLNYSQGKIKNTKGGRIKTTCPCPDCDKPTGSPVITVQAGSPDTQSSTDKTVHEVNPRNILTKPQTCNSVHSVELEEQTSTKSEVISKTLSSYGNEVQVSNCHHHPGHSRSRSYRNEPVIRTYVRDQSTQDGERYMTVRRERQGTPCECRPKKILRKHQSVKYVPLPIEYHTDYDDRDYDNRYYVDERIHERSRRSERYHHKNASSVRVVSPASSSDVSRQASTESRASTQSNRTMILALEEMYKKVQILSQKIHSLVDKSD